MVGTQVGSYRIDEKIGEGGMGTVYRAMEVNLQRIVAIKVLNADIARNPSLGERFRNEARSQANLNHTNIATLYTFLIHEGTAMMVMEFVTGENFQQMISRRGAIPTAEAIPLFKQALLGIGSAHRTGIVHRDIKPANLMLNSSGIVKVMDFGIAKAVGERGLTRTGTQVGTVYYMSPEQVKSEPVDSRSDIYALGITLYEMLSGRVPFLANSEFEVLTDHVKTAPPPPSNFLPSISKGIENIVLKALAKDPKDRFQTAEEFGAALERPDEWTSFVVPTQNYGATRFETAEMNYSMPKESFAATLPLSPPPPPPPPPPTAMAPPAQRQTGLIAGLAAGGVCLAALIGFAAYRFWPGPTSSPAPAPTVTTQIAPVPTPSTQVDATPPTIPLGAFDPKPTTSSPLPATPGRNDSAKPGNHPTASATSAKTSAAIADASAPPPPPPLPPMRTPDVTVPSGQEIVVRLTSAIDAATTQTGLVYSVTINAPISVNGRPAIPAGATAEIEVAHFEKPNRTKGGGKLDLSLKSITLAGHKYTVTSDRYELTGASRAKKGGKFGIVGAVAGGVKRAVGSRGSEAADTFSDLDLASESLLDFHLSAALTLTAR